MLEKSIATITFATWPCSTTDSMRVSEALDSGSIPDEATTFNYNLWIIKLEKCRFC